MNTFIELISSGIYSLMGSLCKIYSDESRICWWQVLRRVLFSPDMIYLSILIFLSLIIVPLVNLNLRKPDLLA